jgi:hypothetical protein
MPEEGIETQELKESLEETHEHASHHGEGVHTKWLLWLSLSTAFLAVFAAIAALESGSNANEAILRKDDAILHQSRADDAWAYYQAKGIESAIYTTQAEAMPSADLGQKWRSSAQKEAEERATWRGKAEEEERKVEANDAAAERSLHVHHQFATSVTVFQVAIALAAIAALTRLKRMWWVSLGLGIVGAFFFFLGFFPA